MLARHRAATENPQAVCALSNSHINLTFSRAIERKELGTFPFSQLPPELRTKIHKLHLIKSDPITFSKQPNLPSVFFVSKTMYNEAKEIFYTYNRFECTSTKLKGFPVQAFHVTLRIADRGHTTCFKALNQCIELRTLSVILEHNRRLTPQSYVAPKTLKKISVESGGGTKDACELLEENLRAIQGKSVEFGL